MKKAIIVGASSGIGKGLSKLLVKNNYIVGITGRRTNLLTEIKNENPERYIVKTFDITNTESIPENLSELIEKLKGLDLFIICAGVGEENLSLDFEIEKRIINTNVLGFTAITDWVYKYFENQKFGHLVAITSIAGLRGSSKSPSYNASKAFEHRYLEGLRQKAHKLKLPITITDVRPGFVDTAMAIASKLFWVASVDKATRQIYRAIKHKRNIIYITKRWKIIAIMLKLIPNYIYYRR